MGLALLTTWAIQYFVINRYFDPQGASGEIKSGQSFTAPLTEVESKPLNKEVQFASDSGHGTPTITTLDTKHAIYKFSTEGASLTQVTFKRVQDGVAVLINTLESENELDKEKRSFLVALDQKTPYIFQLQDEKTLADQTVLTYSATTDQATLEKIFTIHHEQCKIDLTLHITPHAGTLHPRILFAAPYVPEVKDDLVSVIYSAENGSIKKEARAKLDMNKGWFAPTLFGTEDRYFVHALVADQNSFVQRAYCNLTGQSGLISILEGPAIKEKTEWKLSFYFGPKEECSMNSVDPRLQQTLDYSGLLAPISRFLLEILKFLYCYLHNYGWAIVLLTLLINLILLPFNLRSNKSMKQYSEFQKKLAYLQTRYKDDPERLTQERADLISKGGMPGLGGCLPKLLQLPIFFALSRVLSSSIELYKAPFIGWIHDLSAKDPYYILPILIAICMLFQAPTNDPKQRFTMIAVALVFGAFASNFSAGLCLYIFVGVLLNGVQNLIQQKFNWA